MKEMELIGVAIIGLFVVVAAAYALIGSVSSGGYILAQGSQQAVQQGSNQATIPIVDGKQYMKIGMNNYNYDPGFIKVKVGIPVRLEFDMSEVRGCLTTVKIPKANVVKHLTSDNDVIEFTPTQPGVYSFSCSMGMAGGQIIAEL